MSSDDNEELLQIWDESGGEADNPGDGVLEGCGLSILLSGGAGADGKIYGRVFGR